MSPAPGPTGDPVAELLGQYVEAHIARGVTLDPEALCRDTPQLLAPLREHIREYHRIERTLAPAGELATGHELLHFRILEKLGEGGMGQVYMAEDTKLGRRVALKVLPPEMAEDPERLSRFRREARVVAATNHPNIVTVHSVEEADGHHFLTMELVDGETLRQSILAGGMALDRLVSIALGVADALAAAHQRGITHRDLKPDNIMVGADGRVRVLDFGLAKRAVGTPVGASSRAITETLTEAGRVLGTLPYMSPEQLLGEPVDARSDIFAFGVILFEMATGGRPFDSDKPAELISAILRDIPEPVHELRGELPSRLGSVVKRCLEKQPAGRYGTARELRYELAELGNDLMTPANATVASPAEAETENAAAAAPAPHRWRSWWRPALALLAVLAVGSVQWLRPLPGGHSPSTESPNVVEPAIGDGGAAIAKDSGTEGLMDQRPSVAVLFFENLSDDSEWAWLRRGLTDLVVTDLSHSSEIRVLGLGRLRLILKQLDALEEPPSFEVIQGVAKEADVEAVILGSFARVGDLLRVAFTVEDAVNGTVLQSGHVEGHGLESVFELVNQLSASILGNLVTVRTPGQRSTIQAVTTSSLEAWRLYTVGTELYQGARQQEAVASLKQAVEIDPTFALALADLGTIHNSLGLVEEGRNYTRRALELADRLPTDHRYRIEAGYFGARWTTLDRAIEIYEDSLALDPAITNLRNNLARRYAFVERYEDAIREFEHLIAGGTSFGGTYFEAASAHAALGNFDVGYRLVSDFARRHPDDWQAQLYVGWHLTEWGKLDQASAVLDVAAELQPSDSFVHYARWRLAVRREDWSRADLQAEALGAAGDAFSRWRSAASQARNLLYRGHARQALAQFDRAARTTAQPDSFSALARCWKAELHSQLGEWQLVLAEAEQAREQGRAEWPELLGIFLAAQAEQQLGRPETAAELVANLRQGWDKRRNRVEERQIAQLEGLLALEKQQLELAIETLSQAAALLPANGVEFEWHVYPQHVPIWYDLARAHLAAGHDDSARPWLERIIASGSEHVEQPVPYIRSFYLLGEIQLRSGEVDAARRSFQRFLGYWRDGDLDRPWVETALAQTAERDRI